jgi:DMSO/TMAO reductase YedYZ molybdopterin-dependent catalytic subunit
MPATFSLARKKLEVKKMIRNDSKASRRNFLYRGLQGIGVIFLTGCDKLYDNETFQKILRTAEGANRTVQRLLTSKNKLAQEFSESDISAVFRRNGNPAPTTPEYVEDAANHWRSWRLSVTGLVAQPSEFSLGDLQSMPSRTQITRHDCVEGWSAIGKWKGVPLARIIERVQPAAEARYVVFHCLDTSSRGIHYYESISLEDALHPQTILAYDLNDKPVPIANGAPLRLRVENQLGYKHAKYIRALEFVASFEHIGQGKGGYWEDQGYEWYAGI